MRGHMTCVINVMYVGGRWGENKFSIHFSNHYKVHSNILSSVRNPVGGLPFKILDEKPLLTCSQVQSFVHLMILVANF